MKISQIALSLILVVFFRSVQPAGACGIDWEVPKNHFDGVNQMGQLSYWTTIGNLDFGDNFKIPLVANFNPTRGSSPYLGKGWSIPLLESNVVQVDERKFLLTQPDGITRQFWRKSPTDTILLGQGDWKGELKKDTVTLWASCGWKLTFYKGKISTITTPENRVLTLAYFNGRVSEIREKGKVILTVDNDGAGSVKGLSYGANHIAMEMEGRPRVDVVQGMNVVGGVERSIHKLSLPDGRQEIYDFTVDDSLQPTLKISGDVSRLFRWDPSTGQARKVGDWTYKITPNKDPFENAKIERVNSAGQTEMWFLNKSMGEEIVQNLDGTKIVKRRFKSGVVENLVRSIEKYNSKDVLSSTQRFSYDELGRKVRESREDGSTTSWTYYADSFKRKTEENFDSNGKISYTKEFSPQGRLTYKKTPVLEYILKNSIAEIRRADRQPQIINFN